MLLLVADVARHGGNLRLANRKRTITTLPIELCKPSILPLDPNRTAPFNVADQFAYVDTSYRDQQMNMVECTTRNYHSSAIFAYYTANVAVKSGFDLGCYEF